MAQPSPDVSASETSPSPAPSLSSPTRGADAAPRWQPVPRITWQWQLSAPPVDTSFTADAYDIDLFDNTPDVVSRLHAQGSKVICYISAGSWEDWREDKDRFPNEIIGKKYIGWSGERWLDIRRIDLLAPIMRARLDLCKSKGFDAVEPDNIDGYDTDTGFPLTYEDQLRYNLWLAEEAHARNLAIALKNNPEQVTDLLPFYDFAISEDCFAQGWCEKMLPFIHSGKAVLAAEYTDTGIQLQDVCPQASQMSFSVILKNRSLDAPRQTCP
ncbi:MAG: endo alpha-1,4 polygalactosaminidase [Anaerolineae bacterium]|nr:endo alpha-1,4 polygalactosaminidase [Anaerolineae bacterium]